MLYLMILFKKMSEMVIWKSKQITWYHNIEQALVKDVTKLLLEPGTGFAFLGNQYHLNVGGDDFYIDLLFYNLVNAK